jgi:hypothetical protein
MEIVFTKQLFEETFQLRSEQKIGLISFQNLMKMIRKHYSTFCCGNRGDL